MRDVYITGASRTAIAAFQGAFSTLSAPELGGAAIKAALQQYEHGKVSVDEVIFGCVLPAGLGQAPARQAAFKGGLDEHVPATTINKMCGSGMKAAMMAFDQIRAEGAETVIAGGMESMTNAPYLMPKMRAGARMGHSIALDHMFLDGLEDAYEKGQLMGAFAEKCASEYQLSRSQQDEFALQSLENARAAQANGAFKTEIVPVVVTGKKKVDTVAEDEAPLRAMPEKIPTLKPAFKVDGTITAANSSSISDGAAALVLSSSERAKVLNTPLRARVAGHASHAHEPSHFATAPIPAARKLLQALDWDQDDVDLWEVNEAFAVVPMAFMQEMGISRDRINVNGGACALGHPIGASGARIIVTLLNALETRGLKRGIAAICIGGGEATAIAIERV